jgi:hypothetical protein
LKVYGIEGLRIADASIMPRVTSGNTMAPCVIIGEQAAKFMACQLSTAAVDIRKLTLGIHGAGGCAAEHGIGVDDAMRTATT